MKNILIICVLCSVLIQASSCTPIRGCTEDTADNYDISAEEDDGTCIPAIDKVVGSYTYTRIWTDVVTGNDTIDFGNVQITEANTADNHYVANFNGSLFLQGAIIADNLYFETHADVIEQYSGTGTWRRQDSVNLVLDISYLNFLLAVPQPLVYYCTKLPQ